MRILILVFVLAIWSAGSQAEADELLDSYQARLSSADHFNSDGVRLQSAAAIIRQDRANFYRFGVRDPEDEDDSFFSSVQNRARLEAMLNAGSSTASARQSIVNGTPLIRVEIYRDFINVEVY